MKYQVQAICEDQYLKEGSSLRFGSENQFPLNFSHEYILVQK